MGTTGVASAGRRNGRAAGFPPEPLTEWGPTVNLGDGRARTFTTATPSGNPLAHGLLLDRAALDGLPSASDLEDADEYDDKYGPAGLATVVHGEPSLEFFVPVPSVEGTPITFLGLNWNPGGHPPPDVYGVPHFDVHFHALSMDAVDAIDGPALAAHEVPDARIPTGYSRPPDPNVGGPVVVTDMGEHLVDQSAPEFRGEPFRNALIWGAYDADDDGLAELTFVEPMVTRAYLRDLSGTDQRPVPQPEDPHGTGPWPTRYGVRDVPSRDAIAVTIRGFETDDAVDVPRGRRGTDPVCRRSTGGDEERRESEAERLCRR